MSYLYTYVLSSLLSTFWGTPKTQLSSVRTSNEIDSFQSIGLKASKPMKDSFLIGIYWPPVWEHSNDKQYGRMREAHIDIIQNHITTDLSTQEKNLKILDLAKKFGLKVLVADSRLNGSKKDVEDFVKSYKDHPGTGGYMVKDEPYPADFDSCLSIYNTILEMDPHKILCVNLHPIYAPIPNYETQYVEAWVKKVKAQNLKYLSFDYYPFSANGNFLDSFYVNLDIIRRIGLKYDVKTSSYLQSMGLIPPPTSKGTGLKRPNAVELRHNVYTTLAYGIKHPVWFTYWTVRPGPGYGTFTSAIIDSLGNPTNLYLPFKKLNREMKQLGKTLIELDAKDVFHTGDIQITGKKIIDGLPGLPSDFIVQPRDPSAELIITRFIHRANGKKYVMIVNKSFSEQKTLIFHLKSQLNSLHRISEVTGNEESVKINLSDNSFQATFLPGEGKLFLLNTN